ncbi:hypothetical protein [Streptomyces sp. IMTB 2501]|nr:hypothetical protein [Streptomyces sp. IMTB 2501]
MAAARHTVHEVGQNAVRAVGSAPALGHPTRALLLYGRLGRSA